ncbi:MAG: carbon storage regulator CsrA [Bacillus sp. (in: Bacteria)]|nr:carbon storage regulator CsrA [Bacillus sp. (in: firmicutes)]
MLVLSRKLNEAIQIGDDIEIKILSITNDQVKIGIKAPKHLEIYRKEIYIDIQKENAEASKEVNNLLSLLKQNNDKSR